MAHSLEADPERRSGREDGPADQPIELSAPGEWEQPRRRVDLKGTGLLEDGTTFPLAIVELSCAGCKIETDIALFPGVELSISTPATSGAVAGRVRWHKDGNAGIEFIPDESAGKSLTPRSHSRVSLDASVSLRRAGGHQYETALLDLTPAGCKVEFVERPRRGDRIWVRFDNLQPIEASVAWVDGFRGGLKFTRPMHGAIFDVLLARFNR